VPFRTGLRNRVRAPVVRLSRVVFAERAIHITRPAFGHVGVGRSFEIERKSRQCFFTSALAGEDQSDVSVELIAGTERERLGDAQTQLDLAS